MGSATEKAGLEKYATYAEKSQSGQNKQDLQMEIQSFHHGLAPSCFARSLSRSR